VRRHYSDVTCKYKVVCHDNAIVLYVFYDYVIPPCR